MCKSSRLLPSEGGGERERERERERGERKRERERERENEWWGGGGPNNLATPMAGSEHNREQIGMFQTEDTQVQLPRL